MPDDLPLDAVGPARPRGFSSAACWRRWPRSWLLPRESFAPVDWARWLALIFTLIAAPAALTVAIIYSRGAARAFSIGGMFFYWAFLICWARHDDWDKYGFTLPDEDQLLAAVGIVLCIASVLVGGLLAVGVRWFVGGCAAARPSGAVVQLPPQQNVPERRPFQFSLRTMFIVTAVVALICGGLFAPLQFVAFGTMAALAILIPMALTIAIVYARGYLRTFCVGAMFPAGTVLLPLLMENGLYLPLSALSSTDPLDQEGRVAVAIYVALYLAFIVLCGLVAIGVRWMIESPQRCRTRTTSTGLDRSRSAGRPPAMDNPLRPCLNRRKQRQRIRASRLCFSITSHADGPTVMLKHNLRLCDDCPGRFHVKPPDAVGPACRAGPRPKGPARQAGPTSKPTRNRPQSRPCPTTRSRPAGPPETPSQWQALGPPEDYESACFADQLRIPQFGIIHLFLWTTVTAVLLSIELPLWADELPRGGFIGYLWQKVSIILSSIMGAAELVAAGVLLRARCHTMPRRLQPGHWLVLIGALTMILHLAVWGTVRLVFDDWRAAGEIGFFASSIPAAAAVAVFALAAVMLRDAWRWKILFGATALVKAAAFAVALLLLADRLLSHQFSFMLYNALTLAAYLPAFVVILLVAAVVLDLPRRAERDWVHWLGVFCLGFGSAMGVASHIVLTLFARFQSAPPPVAGPVRTLARSASEGRAGARSGLPSLALRAGVACPPVICEFHVKQAIWSSCRVHS